MAGYDNLANPEKPYSLENMAFWLEHLPEDLILDIVNTLGKQTQRIDSWTKVIQENTDIEITLTGLGDMSISSICDKVLDASNIMKEVLQLAYSYAREIEKQKKKAGN